jgi:hypothetical protein
MNLSFGSMIFQLLDAFVDPDQVQDDARPNQQNDRHDYEQLILGKKFHHCKPHEWCTDR